MLAKTLRTQAKRKFLLLCIDTLWGRHCAKTLRTQAEAPFWTPSVSASNGAQIVPKPYVHKLKRIFVFMYGEIMGSTSCQSLTYIT